MRFFLFLYLSHITFHTFSQEFSISDSLRGNLTDVRTCYDVYYYDLELTIDDKNKKIINSRNDIYLTSIQDFETIQIDLFDNFENGLHGIGKINKPSKNLIGEELYNWL